VVLTPFADHAVHQGIHVHVAENLDQVGRKIVVQPLAVPTFDADEAALLVELRKRKNLRFGPILLGHVPEMRNIVLVRQDAP